MLLAIIFENMLLLAAFLCTLTAGFVFAFATVVMPGLGNLNDREFIRAFQVIDGVIQNNHPLFIAMWAGSVAALVVTGVLGISQLEGLSRAMLVISAIAYLVGVQLPTFKFNIPLNNRLQKVDTQALGESELKMARGAFEATWVRWNTFRTVIASLVSAALIILIFIY